jgi:succinate-semialdehyde dehydrogenase/glutarate-semialdehyde dehydrogenase
MPWNFPFYQVIRFIPSLMGNTGVLKHASNVQGCAAIEDAFIKAGFPRGVFMNLNVEGKNYRK